MNPTIILLLNLVSNSIVLTKLVFNKNGTADTNLLNNELSEHTLVTDSGIFPYVVAVLKMSTYLSAGALINEDWVVTAADSLYLIRDFSRVIRVRLGSINYKKGGVLLPIKYIEIHPYFDDTKPSYDIALLKLPYSVRLTPNMNPVRLQKKLREITATHFIVTFWPPPMSQDSKDSNQLQSMEEIKRRRILTVSHLHPTDSEKCMEELEGLDLNSTAIMCLDPGLGEDPCVKNGGAPVVLNGILWGIISSWEDVDCEKYPSPTFVTLVAARDVSAWIHSMVSGHVWNKAHALDFVDDEVDDDYDDNYIKK